MARYRIVIRAEVSRDWSELLDDHEAATIMRIVYGPGSQLELSRRRPRTRTEGVDIDLQIHGEHDEGLGVAAELAAVLDRIGSVKEQFVFDLEEERVVLDHRAIFSSRRRVP